MSSIKNRLLSFRLFMLGLFAMLFAGTASAQTEPTTFDPAAAIEIISENVGLIAGICGTLVLISAGLTAYGIVKRKAVKSAS